MLADLAHDDRFGRAAAALQIGDQVWFRHAKAGELCERSDRMCLIQVAAVC
jgi:D-serine deaminase-like pyridoxal phosphate-dependent protein